MSREDFKSFVVTDPNLVDQQLDVSKLATTTPTRKELLGGISTLPGVKYDPTLQSSFTDLLAYFSGGLPRLPQTPTASNVNVPLPGGSGGGGGGITTASTVQPATGGVSTTQPMDQAGAIAAMTQGPAYTTPTPSDPFLPTGSTTTLPSGDVFATDDPTLQEKIDFTPETKNIFQKAGQTVSGAAEDLKNAGYSVVQQGKDLIANIGGKSIDIGKTIGTGAMNLIGSKITGVPLLGTAAQMIGATLPKQDPRQTALNELYNVTDGTIQTGPMAGYNPVSGGIPGISDPTYGLQDAYDKRIGTIENTLKDKYNMSDAEIADVKAGSYKGDVDTNLLDTLTDLEDAKKKEADVLGITAAEDKRLGEAEMRQTIADAVRQRDLGITAAGDKRLGEAKMKQTIADAVRQRDLGITAAEDKRLGEAKMKQTIADAELLQSNYEKIRDSGGDDISFEEYIENLKRSPPIPGQYEDMIDTDNPFASADEEFDIDPAVPYDVYDDIRQETPKLGVGSDYDKDFETYLGGDPFIDQPAPYRDPIMDMVGTDLGGDTYTSPYIEDPDAPLNDPFAPVGSGRGEDPRQFMDQPAPYRDPIMDMVGTNLGGGGGGGPEGLAYDVFPEGDLQNIIATSPTQKDYNIRATKDLVENLPGGIVRDVLAPAAAGIISLPYDAIQAAQRMKPDSGISGFIDAYKAENPLSSAYERMVGAAGPLAERFEDFNIMGTAQAAETDMEQRLDTPDQRAKEQADAQRAMQEQIAAAERQEAARQAQAEQAAQRAAEQQARAQREMQERIEAAEREEAARRDRENRQREQEQQAAAQRAAEARAARERARRASEEAAARARARHRDNNGGGSGGGSSGGGSRGGGGGGYTGGGWCFDPNTFVQMADGSKKKIKEIQLGDNTKGGEVTGVFQFKAADEIHDYKGVTVAGSHYVKENGKFIMVQDSPLAVKIDKIPVVYSLDTTGRRIFINNIEFADYNGDGIAKGFLHNAGLDLNGFNKEVLRQVENRLI